MISEKKELSVDLSILYEICFFFRTVFNDYNFPINTRYLKLIFFRVSFMPNFQNILCILFCAFWITLKILFSNYFSFKKPF